MPPYKGTPEAEELGPCCRFGPEWTVCVHSGSSLHPGPSFHGQAYIELGGREGGGGRPSSIHACRHVSPPVLGPCLHVSLHSGPAATGGWAGPSHRCSTWCPRKEDPDPSPLRTPSPAAPEGAHQPPCTTVRAEHGRAAVVVEWGEGDRGVAVKHAILGSHQLALLSAREESPFSVSVQGKSLCSL